MIRSPRSEIYMGIEQPPMTAPLLADAGARRVLRRLQALFGVSFRVAAGEAWR